MFDLILDTIYSLQKPKVLCKECEHYYENGLGYPQCVRKRKFHKDYTTGHEYVDAPQYEEIYTIFDGADNEYHVSSHHVSPLYQYIDKCTWLPRQDQLEELTREGWINFNPRKYAYEFWNWIAKTSPKHNSTEQMKLEFLMATRFYKKWNGSEWIKQ